MLGAEPRAVSTVSRSLAEARVSTECSHVGGGLHVHVELVRVTRVESAVESFERVERHGRVKVEGGRRESTELGDRF